MSRKITGRLEKLTGYRRTTSGIWKKFLGYWRNLWDIGELDRILEKLT